MESWGWGRAVRWERRKSQAERSIVTSDSGGWGRGTTGLGLDETWSQKPNLNGTTANIKGHLSLIDCDCKIFLCLKLYQNKHLNTVGEMYKPILTQARSFHEDRLPFSADVMRGMGGMPERMELWLKKRANPYCA